MGASTWKLYFVTDDDDFECDYVIAKAARRAERLFTEQYGDLPGHAELVTVVTSPSPSLTEACWLGPDPDLAEFGGERMASLDFPRWRFGDRVWGPPTTMAERYGKPAR